MTAGLLDHDYILAALIDNDLPKFDRHLRTARLSNALLSAILIHAIRQGNAKAVRILIEEHHAPPEPVIFDVDVTYPVAEALNYSKMANYLVEDSAGNRVTAAHEILRLLVTSGAGFQQCREHHMPCPLFHHIFTLATHAPDAAGFLLKALPPSSYTGQKFHSPLDNFLRYFMPSDFTNRSELTRFVAMLKYAVVPLIRLGARIRSYSSFNEMTPFFNLRAFDANFSFALWGAPNMLVRLFIEATWTSSLENKRKMRSGTILEPSEAALNVLRSEFPRSLQCQCRTATLRRLPAGPNRALAISSLQLPSCLSLFLNFSDYEFD